MLTSTVRHLYRAAFVKVELMWFHLIKKLEKLHFTTLNYTPIYTLHSKQFKCTFCTLNYNPCYTMHPDVKFTVMFEGNL